MKRWLEELIGGDRRLRAGIVATRDDDVLFPVDYINKTIFILSYYVTCIQPSID